MSTETNAAHSADHKARIHIGPSGEKALKAYEKEIATYVSKLPQLLEEGEGGRFALIKGDDILSTWDTYRDASQAGREKFGLEAICVMKIEARDVERYAALMEQIGQRKCQS